MTKTFKQIREGDVPKDHEYGPSSRKRPAGKRGYTSSDSARTTHLKTVKKWSKKKRRQGDKKFANEAPEHPRNIRFGDSRAKQVAIDTIKNPSKGLLGGPTAAEAEKVLKVKFGYTDAQIKKLQEANWSISPEKQKEVNKFLAKSTGGSMHQDVNLVMKKFGLSKSKAQDMVFNWMSSWSPDKRLSAWGPKDMPEESPANATGSAVAGTGDDSSTVLVKKRKELQKRLMRRFSIKETLDKILPDPVEKEDVITTRKKQLKELAKNRNV